MIGELINKFESLDTQNVANFNDLFPMSKLDYPEDFTVEIGGMFGRSREIKINGESTFHELKIVESLNKNVKKGNRHTKPGFAIEVFKNNGDFIGEYPSAQHAQTYLNISASTYYLRVKRGEYIVKGVRV